MNDKLRGLFESLIPFMVFGIAVSLVIGLFIMFSYVLVWGIIIGGLLWMVFLVKNFLFPARKLTKTEGRIIEHENKND